MLDTVPGSLILKLEGDKVYYDQKSYLPLNKTNIPGEFNNFKKNTFWHLSVIKYNPADASVFARIIKYNGSETLFKKQLPGKFCIKAINFDTIDTFKLLHCTERPPVKISEIKKYDIKEKPEPHIADSSLEKYQGQKLQQPVQPTFVKEILTINTRIPISELNFSPGCVTCQKFLPELSKPVLVRIDNPNFHPEFNVIKNYIIKALKFDQVIVSLEIEAEKSESGKIRRHRILKAYSSDIDRIDRQLLEQVKAEHVVDLIIKPKMNEDLPLNLYTARDFIDKKLVGALKPENLDTEQVLNKILTDTNARHYLQLTHLSRLHQVNVFRLRFSFRPFSFLFLIEGKTRHHFVLETFNEELATYIWHVEKNVTDLKTKYKEIEQLIKAFEDSNRILYRKTRPGNFSIITHDYLDKENGFNKWKARLDEIIV